MASKLPSVLLEHPALALEPAALLTVPVEAPWAGVHPHIPLEIHPKLPHILHLVLAAHVYEEGADPLRLVVENKLAGAGRSEDR